MPIPITCIEDLSALAKQRIPRMFRDHVDTGSHAVATYRANEAGSRVIELRQRVGVDIGHSPAFHACERSTQHSRPLVCPSNS